MGIIMLVLGAIVSFIIFISYWMFILWISFSVFLGYMGYHGALELGIESEFIRSFFALIGFSIGIKVGFRLLLGDK